MKKIILSTVAIVAVTMSVFAFNSNSCPKDSCECSQCECTSCEDGCTKGCCSK